jgi:hypothetical protein
MSVKHTHDPTCPSCEEKKKDAHPYMRDWFDRTRFRHNDAHISWSYRDKESQEDAFARGATKCHFPKSAHNRVNPETQAPESYALDLFQLTENNTAKFDPMFYARIADESNKNKDEIIWGGNFKSIGDSDHFQYNPDRET